LYPIVKNNPHKQELLKNWTEKKQLFWGGAIAFNETHKKFVSEKINFHQTDSIFEKIYPGMIQDFDSHNIINYHIKKLKETDPEADFCKQILYIELKQRLPELLLMRADKMSMAQGIEAREPFLDHKLVEFMLNVPGNLKFKNNTTKYLLKKICRGILTDEIIDRKKIGFAAPTFRWLNNGKYFPTYFLTKSTTDLKLEKLYKNNILNFAVQKWVLQNLNAYK